MSVKEITTADFQSEVLDSKGVVALEFWASWCGPCRQFSPILEQASEQLEGKVSFLKMNSDENPEIPAKYRVAGIPTLLIFEDGEYKRSLVGARPLNTLLAELN